MKRLIASFVILCLLFAYNLFTEKYVLDFCDSLNESLEICAENIKSKNLTLAEKNITAMLISWQKKDTFLSVIVGDEALIEPQKSIVSIYYCLLDKNYDSCLQGIRECQGYIREICDNTRTNLGNVM